MDITAPAQAALGRILCLHTDGSWSVFATNLHAVFGLHPVYLDDHHPQHLPELRDWLGKLAGHRQLCAVGEFGLDYYLEHLDRQHQQALFEAQLQLAAEFELPALLHVRRAHAATIATLKRFRLARGGIIHAFAGSHEEAREYIKLGFRLGLALRRSPALIERPPAPVQGPWARTARSRKRRADQDFSSGSAPLAGCEAATASSPSSSASACPPGMA